MKRILVVNGSTQANGSTQKLINQFPTLFPEFEWIVSDAVHDLPLFQVDHSVLPQSLENWKQEIQAVHLVLFITPEYLHNIPAQLKSALEWVTTSGELDQKKVIACAYTPHDPRGEKAIQSLTWSLQALQAHIICTFTLHHNQWDWKNEKIQGGEGYEMLCTALEMI